MQGVAYLYMGVTDSGTQGAIWCWGWNPSPAYVYISLNIVKTGQSWLLKFSISGPITQYRRVLRIIPPSIPP